MALGAPLAAILRNVAGRWLGWILFGTAAGMVFARLEATALTSLLFEVEPTDPAVFVSIGVFVLAVAVAACVPGAVRAARSLIRAPNRVARDQSAISAWNAPRVGWS
jgi:hypothetical protein